MRSRSGIVLNLSGHGILRTVPWKQRVVPSFVFGNARNGDDGDENVRMTRFRSETVFHTGNAFRNNRGNFGNGSGNGGNVSNIANRVDIVKRLVHSGIGVCRNPHARFVGIGNVRIPRFLFVNRNRMIFGPCLDERSFQVDGFISFCHGMTARTRRAMEHADTRGRVSCNAFGSDDSKRGDSRKIASIKKEPYGSSVRSILDIRDSNSFKRKTESDFASDGGTETFFVSKKNVNTASEADMKAERSLGEDISERNLSVKTYEGSFVATRKTSDIHSFILSLKSGRSLPGSKSVRTLSARGSDLMCGREGS